MKKAMKIFGGILGAYLLWAFTVAGYGFVKYDMPDNARWEAEQSAKRLANNH